jgi:hypothetical protein
MLKFTDTLSPSPKGFQSPKFSDSDFREVRGLGLGRPKSSDLKWAHLFIADLTSYAMPWSLLRPLIIWSGPHDLLTQCSVQRIKVQIRYQMCGQNMLLASSRSTSKELSTTQTTWKPDRKCIWHRLLQVSFKIVQTLEGYISKDIFGIDL